MQQVDDGFEPLEQFNIAFPKLFKCPGLFLEYIEDGIGAIATINPAGQWVVAEIIPSLLCVLRQGGVEDRLKVMGSGGCDRYQGHGMMGNVSVFFF